MAVGPAPLHQEPGFLTVLRDNGIEAILVASESDLDGIGTEKMPALALIQASSMPWPELKECARRCSQFKLPAIALVADDRLRALDRGMEFDDFVVIPPPQDELLVRARRVLRRVGTSDDPDAIRVGDLMINTVNFEVSVGGRRVNLRYKEYELLLLMASNPGRVYSREALLNQVWGYAYLGGTRTVDVHIRRLRSKIEDADHTFIETVWQVGYRFKDIGHNWE